MERSNRVFVNSQTRNPDNRPPLAERTYLPTAAPAWTAAVEVTEKPKTKFFSLSYDRKHNVVEKYRATRHIYINEGDGFGSDGGITVYQPKPEHGEHRCLLTTHYYESGNSSNTESFECSCGESSYCSDGRGSYDKYVLPSIDAFHLSILADFYGETLHSEMVREYHLTTTVIDEQN